MSHLHGMAGAGVAPTPDILDDWVGIEGRIHDAAGGLSITADGRRAIDRSVRTETDDRTCWVLGDLYGYGDAGSSTDYKSRHGSVGPAQYALSLYDRHGKAFVERLNGNFLLGIYDPSRREFLLCTDRFGTVPLYWSCTDDDTVAFSTTIQALPHHPAVETGFHPGYLHEYLAFRRTFGMRTPLEGVEKLGPGTVATINLDEGSISADQYWRPRYRPRETSFEWFVDEFVRRFRTVIGEWVRDNREYGMLLSGGSDSRLVLAALVEAGADVTAFHMNDWMNAEARTAERVALEADAPFEWLQRGPEYRIDALDRNRCATTFNGWFTQPYTSGFEDEITGRADRVLSGLYGDSLFRGYGVPSPTVSLGRFGSMTLPVERRIDSVGDYIDLLVERAHDGFDLPTDLRSVLNANVYRDGDRISHHGVVYNSIDELVYYGGCYPLSNDDDMRFHTGLRRLGPYHTPYLDNRLLDLSLSMPVRYRLRRNLIDRAIGRIAPELAAIPHASTGTKLSRPFPVKYAGEHLTELRYKYGPKHAPPEPFLTQGPWLDDAELLRSHRFVPDVVAEKRELADALPGLTAEKILDLYDDHCRGEDHVGELYTALTVLTMPATARVLTTDPEVSNRITPMEPLPSPSRRKVVGDD